MESKSFRKPYISPDSSDSESSDFSSRHRNYKTPDVNESTSKKHSKSLEKKRTNDSMLNH